MEILKEALANNKLKEEAYLQSLIYNDKGLQKDICNILNIDFNKTKFEREKEIMNGLKADFIVFEDNKIKAIVECKGANIKVTDFVRGIGQIFQYGYFAKNKLSIKNYNFCDYEDFLSVYIFPDTVLKNNNFNVALFEYPKNKKLVEINSTSLALRLLNDELLAKLSNNCIRGGGGVRIG